LKNKNICSLPLLIIDNFLFPLNYINICNSSIQNGVSPFLENRTFCEKLNTSFFQRNWVQKSLEGRSKVIPPIEPSLFGRNNYQIGIPGKSKGVKIKKEGRPM